MLSPNRFESLAVDAPDLYESVRDFSADNLLRISVLECIDRIYTAKKSRWCNEPIIKSLVSDDAVTIAERDYVSQITQQVTS